MVWVCVGGLAAGPGSVARATTATAEPAEELVRAGLSRGDHRAEGQGAQEGQRNGGAEHVGANVCKNGRVFRKRTAGGQQLLDRGAGLLFATQWRDGVGSIGHRRSFEGHAIAALAQEGDDLG